MPKDLWAFGTPPNKLGFSRDKHYQESFQHLAIIHCDVYEELQNNNFLQKGKNPTIILDSCKKHCHENGTVAQSVEQRTFNPLVASSNLARPTKMYNGYSSSYAMANSNMLF